MEDYGGFISYNTHIRFNKYLVIFNILATHFFEVLTFNSTF